MHITCCWLCMLAACTLCSGCACMQAVGMLSSAAVAGWLISHLGPQLVLAAMSALPLSVVLASARVQEQRTDYRLLSKASSLSSIPIQVRGVLQSQPWVLHRQ